MCKILICLSKIKAWVTKSLNSLTSSIGWCQVFIGWQWDAALGRLWGGGFYRRESSHGGHARIGFRRLWLQAFPHDVHDLAADKKPDQKSANYYNQNHNRQRSHKALESA